MPAYTGIVLNDFLQENLIWYEEISLLPQYRLFTEATYPYYQPPYSASIWLLVKCRRYGEKKFSGKFFWRNFYEFRLIPKFHSFGEIFAKYILNFAKILGSFVSHNFVITITQLPLT
jgi:hypothetical protein